MKPTPSSFLTILAPSEKTFLVFQEDNQSHLDGPGDWSDVIIEPSLQLDNALFLSRIKGILARKKGKH